MTIKDRRMAVNRKVNNYCYYKAKKCALTDVDFTISTIKDIDNATLFRCEITYKTKKINKTTTECYLILFCDNKFFSCATSVHYVMYIKTMIRNIKESYRFDTEESRKKAINLQENGVQYAKNICIEYYGI